MMKKKSCLISLPQAPEQQIQIEEAFMIPIFIFFVTDMQVMNHPKENFVKI